MSIPEREPIMGDNKEVWWKAIKAALVAMLTIAALIALIYFLFKAAPLLTKGENTQSEIQLPLLAIGGVVALLASLTLVAIGLSALGLSDKTQALGLPEGSIRAVIALSLTILFGIITIFLFT